MKKFITTIVFAALIPIMIFAHPAKKVEVTYDSSTGKLKITATHSVSDPSKHYIETITITVDGKVLKTETYTQQSDKSIQEVQIQIPELKKGSVVVVNTKCNKGGSKKTTITI